MKLDHISREDLEAKYTLFVDSRNREVEKFQINILRLREVIKALEKLIQEL